MASQTQYILQQLGLSDGYHIPIANDENLKLEAELQRLIAAKANATATLDSISGRLRGLNKHNKYVQAEQTENQVSIIDIIKHITSADIWCFVIETLIFFWCLIRFK